MRATLPRLERSPTRPGLDPSFGTRRAVENAGYTSIEEREVVMVGLEDRPGALGETARKIADAGVNIELVSIQ